MAEKSVDITTAYVSNLSALKRFLSRFVFRPQDIEDISQEAFLRAFKAEKGTSIDNPRAFLFRTAKNVALNELSRKSNILAEYIEENCSSDVLLDETSAEKQFDDRRKYESFCEVVAELPARCQRVFVMRKVYGFSQKEIAGALGISVGTVEKHIAKGLLRCKEQLRKDSDGESGTGQQTAGRPDGG